MIKIIIAEDNEIERETIKTLLGREQDVVVIGEANDGQEALKQIQELKPDAAILDINMPKLSGIELAQKIEGKLYFIFITAYQEYVLNAFDVGSTDYLLKPINPERFAISIKRIRKLVNTKKTNQYLTVKNKGAIMQISIDNIIFMEKMPGDKKIIINTTEGEYIVGGTLESFESKVIPYGHIRSHKSFIINLNKVRKLIPWGNKCFLVILQGTKKEVFISRSYASFVKKALGRTNNPCQ